MCYETAYICGTFVTLQTRVHEASVTTCEETQTLGDWFVVNQIFILYFIVFIMHSSNPYKA